MSSSSPALDFLDQLYHPEKIKENNSKESGILWQMKLTAPILEPTIREIKVNESHQKKRKVPEIASQPLKKRFKKHYPIFIFSIDCRSGREGKKQKETKGVRSLL